LNKKVLAVAIATLMILSILPLTTVSADHYANPSGAPPSSWDPDHDPRDPAPKPRDAVDRVPCDTEGPMCVFLHPGVADSYKEGWSHTLGTLWGLDSGQVVPGQPGTNAQTRQVFDKYLDYAIMASSSDSVGDLQFDITVVDTVDQITIYVHPSSSFEPKQRTSPFGLT